MGVHNLHVEYVRGTYNIDSSEATFELNGYVASLTLSYCTHLR